MKGMVKRLFKRALVGLTSDYRINWVYAANAWPEGDDDSYPVVRETYVHCTAFRSSSTAKIRSSQSYADIGLAGLVLTGMGRPLAVAHFAEVTQYNRNSTWPLRNGEVALMDIATEERERGHGLAPRLLRAAVRYYLRQGRERLIAFIWWSNKPSLRAFEKAGWKRIGCSVELRFGRRWVAIRIPLPGSD